MPCFSTVARLRVLGLAALLGAACKDKPAPPPPAAPQVQAPVVPRDQVIVVVLSEHDGVDAARQGLAAALRLKVPPPLPFPRVERHGDRFRVVLARGKGEALEPLVKELSAAGTVPKIIPQGEAGGDDVVRLAIVCTEGEAAPLLGGSPPKELGRVAPGEVLLPGEDEGSDGDSDEAERGLLKVLAPRPGLIHGPDVLMPADCTPRDEDNDDGNGRILSSGRLCLTTRFSGRDGDVTRAALVAVSPGYRRCQRFPDAGTFDGFDQSAAGTQFAVEAKAPSGAAGIAVYDVGPAGQLTPRFHVPGLARPAYLGDNLVAVADDGAAQAVAVIDAAALRAATAPTPRRVFTLPGARFQPEVPTHRPAAPTLQGGRVAVTFQQACQKPEEKRVRAAARGDFEQCVLEIDVEVGLDGKDPKRRCQLNNSPSGLDQPIATPCR